MTSVTAWLQQRDSNDDSAAVAADDEALCARLYAMLQDASVLHYAHLLHTPALQQQPSLVSTKVFSASRSDALQHMYELLLLFSYGTVRDVATQLSPAAQALVTPAMREKLLTLSLLTYCAERDLCGGGVATYEDVRAALQLPSHSGSDDDNDDDDAVEEVVARAVADGVLHARLDSAARCVRVRGVTVARDVAPREVAALARRLHAWLRVCDEQLTALDTAMRLCGPAATEAG